MRRTTLFSELLSCVGLHGVRSSSVLHVDVTKSTNEIRPKDTETDCRAVSKHLLPSRTV